MSYTAAPPYLMACQPPLPSFLLLDSVQKQSKTERVEESGDLATPNALLSSPFPFTPFPFSSVPFLFFIQESTDIKKEVEGCWW